MASADPPSLDCFECSVCLESMLDKRPVALSCLHTFCTPCISRLYERGPPLTCPTCRTETVVPDGDINQLPVNRDLIKIMEREKQIRKVPENLCDTCLRKGSRSPSAGICAQCIRKLCTACIDQHKKMSVFKDHQLLIKNTNKKEATCCPIHGETLQFICMHCLDALCLDCISDGSHIQHDQKLQNFQDGIANIRQGYTKEMVDAKRYLKELKDKKQQICSDFKAIEKSKMEIADLVNMLNRMVTEAQSMLQKVNVNEDSVKKAEKQINGKIKEAQQYEESLKATLGYSDIALLAHRKKNPIMCDYVIDSVNIKTKEYKIPVFEIYKKFSGTDWAALSIGTLKELSSYEHLKNEESSRNRNLSSKACYSCGQLPCFSCRRCKAFLCDKHALEIGCARCKTNNRSNLLLL